MNNRLCTPLDANNNYNYELLSALSATDINWIVKHDTTKAAHIQALLASKSQCFNVIKVTKNQTAYIYFLFEILPISLDQIDKKNLSFINKVGLKLLKCHQFKLAFPAFSMLYDFDFCIADVTLVTESLKLELIASAIESVNTKQDLSIVTFPIQGISSQNTHQLISQFGYELPIQDFTMELDLDPEWTNFDHYLATLKKKYFKRANAIILKGKGLEFKALSLAEIIKNNDKINALYLQIVKAQAFVANTALPNHFVILKEIYKEDFVLEGIFVNGKMVGFSSYFIQNQQLSVHYIGLDYSQNDTFDLYFNILFRMVQIGIETKKTCINFGRTSLEAKASLGAKPKYLSNYFKTFGLTKIIEKQIIKQAKSIESNAWKTRNPFKNEILIEA
jgi:hypothetical protein